MNNLFEFSKKLIKNIYFKISVCTLFSLGICYIICLVIFYSNYSTSLSIQDKANIASTIKNIFHTLFFIITAFIAILSYQQAKLTLFSPIKTEIFKLQIKEFEKLLLFFRLDV